MEPSKKSLKDQLVTGAFPKLVTSVLLAAGFVWLLARGGLPLLPEQESLELIPAWAIAAFVAAQVASNLFRAYRWVFLLRPISPGIKALRVLGIGLVGYSAIFFAPLRLGEIVRPYLVAQDGEVSFMQAAGTVFAERVIDGLVLMLVTILSLSLATTVSPLPNALGDLPLPLAAVPAAVYTATFGFLGLFVAMALFYAARELAARLTRGIIGVVSPRAGNWAATTLGRVADGLGFLPSRKHLFSFVALTCAAWACTIAGHWFLLRGAGFPASLVQAATLVGILGLGVIVPAGPGLFGAYQIGCFTALALFFPLSEVRGPGAALVFVSYVVALVVNAVQLGVGSLLMVRTPPARA